MHAIVWITLVRDVIFHAQNAKIPNVVPIADHIVKMQYKIFKVMEPTTSLTIQTSNKQNECILQFFLQILLQNQTCNKEKKKKQNVFQGIQQFVFRSLHPQFLVIVFSIENIKLRDCKVFGISTINLFNSKVSLRNLHREATSSVVVV